MTTDTTQALTPYQADTQLTRISDDAMLISLWIKGHAPSTQGAYTGYINKLRSYAGDRSLVSLGLNDLQAFADTLQHLSSASQATILSAIKSFYTFAHRLGYMDKNPGALLRTPKIKNTLAQRILSEEQVMSMLTLTKKQRDKVLIRLLYNAGLRVSELCDLQWDDVKPNKDSGQVTVFGKGGKTRVILLSKDTYTALISLPHNDSYVFTSQKGSKLDESQVFRIVQAAGKRIGVNGVSPHWLRHAHASHSLDRGAPISLVKETLGHSDIKTTGKYLHAKPNDSSARYLPV